MDKDIKTSHLLFDEAPLLIRPELACRIGLNEAIVLQQIHYWLENKRKSVKEKDLDKEKTYINGRFWTYDSYAEWQKQFPFWSVRTVERIFTNLENKGILISGTFNERKTDRTKWYTIDYDALDRYVGKTKTKDKNGKNAKVTHSDNLADCSTTHHDKLADCSTAHSDKLADSITTNWQIPSRQVGRLLPKNTLESHSKDFFEDEDNQRAIKRKLTLLGCKLAESKIMRTNEQIDETIKLIVERGLLDFDEADVVNAIEHYKRECIDRKIGKPPIFFVNGFEMKLDERYSHSIGENGRRLRELKEQQQKHIIEQVKSCLSYNWLNE